MGCANFSFDHSTWLPEDYTGIALPICWKNRFEATAKQQSE